MLRDHIIYYIVTNLLDIKKEHFKLNKDFEFVNLHGAQSAAPVWAIEGKLGSNNFQITLSELMVSEDCQEYFLLSKFEDSPTYCSYLCVEDNEPTQSNLCYSPKPDVWIPTNVYLQATYLAGMESLRDVLVEWNSLSNSSEIFTDLLSFYQKIIDSNEEDEVYYEDLL
jgi:hypothetical protein